MPQISHLPFNGTGMLVEQLEGWCSDGQRWKLVGLTKRGLCGHKGAGKSNGLVPVAENQGMGPRDGDLE